MKNYAFIGLGPLAMSMLERIAQVTDRIVVVDRDSQLIDRVKELVKTAYVADILDEEALRKILPEAIDVAIIDVSSDIEAEILVTHWLKKIGVKEIIVKSSSDERSEILKIVGATRVVNSDREAAARIVPLVLSSALYNFMPIGGDLVMAEVRVPKEVVGNSLIEADLRRKHGINVVAVRSENSTNYRDFDRDYKLKADDYLLVAAKEADIFEFSEIPISRAQANVTKGKSSNITAFFKSITKKQG
jgi:trk system potassium uptake protein TrkA